MHILGHIVMETIVSNWTAKVRQIRQAKGMSPVDLAEKTGFSTDYIYKLEEGQRGQRPSVELVGKIASALGVALSELIGEKIA